MTELSPALAELAELRGRAQTLSDPAKPEDESPARAIRRALADGRMKASQVGFVSISGPPGASESIRRAFQRGLGRHSAQAILDTGIGGFDQAALRCAVSVALATTGGRLLLAGASPEIKAVAAAVEPMLPRNRPSGAVALAIGVNGVNLALAFCPIDDQP